VSDLRLFDASQLEHCDVPDHVILFRCSKAKSNARWPADVEEILESGREGFGEMERIRAGTIAALSFDVLRRSQALVSTERATACDRDLVIGAVTSSDAGRYLLICRRDKPDSSQWRQDKENLILERTEERVANTFICRQRVSFPLVVIWCGLKMTLIFRVRKAISTLFEISLTLIAFSVEPSFVTRCSELQ